MYVIFIFYKYGNVNYYFILKYISPCKMGIEEFEYQLMYVVGDISLLVRYINVKKIEDIGEYYSCFINTINRSININIIKSEIDDINEAKFAIDSNNNLYMRWFKNRNVKLLRIDESYDKNYYDVI